MPEEKVPPPDPTAGSSANGNAGLLRRVERLEEGEVAIKERLVRLETRGEVVASQMGTKADKAVMVTMSDLAQLATKADVARVEAAQAATNDELAQLGARVGQMATKAELAQVATALAQLAARVDQMATRADLAALETTLLKWFIGTVIALSAVSVTAIKLIG